MKRDITNFAKTCETCEMYKPSQSESLRHHTPATYAFQYVHMDIGEVRGRYYLFSVDQFSGYPHLYDCGKTATAQQVIDATIHLITLFSVPEVIYSVAPNSLKTENSMTFASLGEYAMLPLPPTCPGQTVSPRNASRR